MLALALGKDLHAGVMWLGAVLGADLTIALHQAPVAQLDRAPDYESGGREFESSPARH